MPLPRFTYVGASSLREACALLAEHGDKARLMAGGTDLIIKLRHRAMQPDYIVGLRGVSGLDKVDFDPVKGLRIGALARLAQVASNTDVRKHYPALSGAAGVTATVQIRNMGTVVGNICNAAPSADTATPLLVYGAEVVIVHPGGERRLALDEFFRGPGLTALESGEIVKELLLPPPVAGSGSDYQKISERSKVDIAAVGVSSLMVLGESGAISAVRIALGAVGPTPLRARRAEKSLAGQVPEDGLLGRAAEMAAEECSPISDMRASADYRRRMVAVLTGRALEQSLAMARSNKAGCEL